MTGPTEPWRVEVSHHADNQLSRLPRPERGRVLAALTKLREGPRQRGVKPLEGRPEWSLRVGGRRLLLRVDETERVVVVVTVGPRGDVYKK